MKGGICRNGGRTKPGGTKRVARLFSSPLPTYNPEFSELRNQLLTRYNQPPRAFQYESTTENRPAARRFLEKYNLLPLTPTNQRFDTAEFERVSGAQVVFVRQNLRQERVFEQSTTTSAHPGVISIDADANGSTRPPRS